MKIVKINSIACPSCIIMNEIFNKIKDKYKDKFTYEEIDYDFDDYDYEVGNILPVFIFMDEDKELDRLIGEVSLEEFDNTIKKYIEVS